MGRAAGRWEQPLFHCSQMGQQQGCRGLLAIPTGAFWTSGTRACGCSQPEADEADRAGRACRDTLHCLQSQICRKGRQAGMGQAGLARLWSLPVAAGPAAHGRPAAAQSWPKGTTTLQMGWPGPLTGAKVQRCSGSALRPLACQSLRPFVPPQAWHQPLLWGNSWPKAGLYSIIRREPSGRNSWLGCAARNCRNAGAAHPHRTARGCSPNVTATTLAQRQI